MSEVDPAADDTGKCAAQIGGATEVDGSACSDDRFECRAEGGTELGADLTADGERRTQRRTDLRGDIARQVQVAAEAAADTTTDDSATCEPAADDGACGQTEAGRQSAADGSAAGEATPDASRATGAEDCRELRAGSGEQSGFRYQRCDGDDVGVADVAEAGGGERSVRVDAVRGGRLVVAEEAEDEVEYCVRGHGRGSFSGGRSWSITSRLRSRSCCQQSYGPPRNRPTGPNPLSERRRPGVAR